MIRCNKERIKTMESNIDIDSDISHVTDKPCYNNSLVNADAIDFRTQMDQLHFYEKTDTEPCQDLWLVSNEECLWQCIVGEIKTPYGLLNNSIGQATYGCEIWKLVGENIDSLMVKEFESYIIDTCLKYDEVNNVTYINTKIGTNNSFLVEITLDSIYGDFDGVLRIPLAKPSDRNWVDADSKFHTS